MRDLILVVGGYGKVGRCVSRTLGERLPGQVVVAGRRRAQAEAWSRETGGKVLPGVVDLTDPSTFPHLLAGVRVVVMCVEQQGTEFVRACIRCGVHYVDVSPSDAFLRQVEELNLAARHEGVAVVLSVGLTPGLTNLLVKRAHETFEFLSRVEIFVLLGLGEAHGEAAVRWTLANMDAPFCVAGKVVRGYSDPRSTTLPAPHGRRVAYRFNFADQHVVSRTLGVSQVQTRLCFDSPLVTVVLAWFSRLGLFRLVRRLGLEGLLVAAFKRWRFGTEAFVVQVVAHGHLAGQAHTQTSSVSGHGEGEMTGRVAAWTAQRVYSGDVAPGVFHLEQVFDPAEVFAAVKVFGGQVDLGSPVAWDRP